MLYLLSQIIEQTSSRYPEKEAFRFKGEALSYASLVRRANQLANTLIDQGVQPGDRVGIYLHKSLECAVAIYGILRAGAAYVPLDPTAPTERIGLILRDCAIRHVITGKSLKGKFKQLAAVETPLAYVIGLDEEPGRPWTQVAWHDIQAASAETPSVASVEQNLAYIIYTSGSTGVPKGIMHTHASGLAYARMAAALYKLTEGDRLSNFPPLHFDQSTFDYFSGPLVGATTVIIPEEHTKLPASLTQLIEAERLTIWYSVPFALIQMLLRGVMEEKELGSLRWIIYGGEPFPIKHLRALQKLLPQAKFSNCYGPAEVNQCTFYTVPPLGDASEDSASEDSASKGNASHENVSKETIPIGQICENMSGIIVGEDDQAVPPGEVGELLVRTPTMMQGYWNQPERNAQAFFVQSGEGGLGQRFYRTGDLVQEGEDGLLYFLGRKDRQVKSRGYRIELDEVEAALLLHPAIDEAAVFPVPDKDGNNLIRAAVIAKAELAPTQSQLFKHLAQRLPPYAIPISLDIMEQFPRTTSNKIDRRALQDSAMVKE